LKAEEESSDEALAESIVSTLNKYATDKKKSACRLKRLQKNQKTPK